MTLHVRSIKNKAHNFVSCFHFQHALTMTLCTLHLGRRRSELYTIDNICTAVFILLIFFKTTYEITPLTRELIL